MMLNFVGKHCFKALKTNIGSVISRRFTSTLDSGKPFTPEIKENELEQTKDVKQKESVPYLRLREIHSIDEETIEMMITNYSIVRTTDNTFFTLAPAVIINFKAFDFCKQAKKTKEPITTYRLQTVVSKKKVSKLAV
ncbi:8464_t:CDS:2, partial [Acaulospora morrowiae]